MKFVAAHVVIAAGWAAGSLILSPGLSASGTENLVRWTTNYYTVTGATAWEVRRSINRARPWKDRSVSDAMTTWTVNWDYTTMVTDQGCRLAGLSTVTTITTTLPRYVPSTNAPLELRQRWARYYSALCRHEAQHAEIGKATAGDVQSRVPGIGERASCEALRRDIKALANSIVDQRKREERELDQRTGHGSLDGARFP